MENKEDTQEFIKIREYFEDHLDNPNARIIKFIPIELWGANHKTKKQARFKILLPSEICDENLKEFDKWFLTIVAIPKEDI